MRFLLPLALTLSLAACDSDPCGGGASCVMLPPDAGADAGFDAGSPVDTGDDRPAPIDQGAPDAGVDVSFHSDPIPLADLGFDLGAADAGSDVGTDRPVDDDAGACGRCTGPHVVRAGCIVRDAMPPQCIVDTCERYFANCNGLIADGCEVDARSDRLNCGGCGQQCSAGQVCMSGICTAPDASVGTGENCTSFGSVACATSAQCQATCLPPPNGAARWCCIGGECGASNNTCARP